MVTLMDIRGDIGRHIRALRMARGWTVREAAPHCGISPAQLNHIEIGRSDTTLTTLQKILEGLGGTDAPLIPAQVDPRSRAVAERLIAVLPHLPDDHLDILLAQLARWEARYLPSSE